MRDKDTLKPSGINTNSFDGSVGLLGDYETGFLLGRDGGTDRSPTRHRSRSTKREQRRREVTRSPTIASIPNKKKFTPRTLVALTPNCDKTALVNIAKLISHTENVMYVGLVPVKEGDSL